MAAETDELIAFLNLPIQQRNLDDVVNGAIERCGGYRVFGQALADVMLSPEVNHLIRLKSAALIATLVMKNEKTQIDDLSAEEFASIGERVLCFFGIPKLEARKRVKERMQTIELLKKSDVLVPEGQQTSGGNG